MDIGGVSDLKYLFGVIIQAFPLFVPQIGSRFPVSDHFNRVLNTYGPVIGGQDNFYFVVCQFFQKSIQVGMLKPGLCKGAVCPFVISQFFDHFHLGPCMRKDVNKIEYNG